MISRVHHALWKIWPSFRYAFRPAKPILLGRLAWAVIRSKIASKPRFRYFDVALDFDCNMRCLHCFATALVPKDRKSTVSIDDLARVCREAMSMGAVNFSFQGGEPLLISDLVRRIQVFKPNLNVISVTTNGSLLTPKRIRELKQAGVDILTVSLDSADPVEHDSFRGFRGAHSLALRAIDEALKQGLHVTVGTTVSHRNLRSAGIKDLILWAEGKKVILVFNLATLAGNWSEDEDILLDEDDMALIRSWVKQYQYIRTDFEANLGKRGCGAVKEILYMTPYGDVLACPFIHISLGNVMKESLIDIRERALQVPEFREYASKCLCAEDSDFIAKYIRVAASRGLLDGFDVFGWKQGE